MHARGSPSPPGGRVSAYFSTVGVDAVLQDYLI